MIPIEQFVYTTATTESQSGYHVVAKSPGITDKLISELEPYMLPSGIDPSAFTQSKSMVIVGGSTQVAYSLARNIGHGPDGRPDAMLSHTLVIDIECFKTLSYDSRNLDQFFSRSVPTSPFLPPIAALANASTKHDPGIARSQVPLFTRTLYALVRGHGAAVREICGEQFAQDALGLLPPSLRLVPFSTCAVDLRRQPAYRLVLLGSSPARNLPKGFDVVDRQSRRSLGGSEVGRAVRHIVAMASVKSPDLAALHADFESITAFSPRKRLAVLTAVLRMAQSPGPMNNDKDLQTAAHRLAMLDLATRDEILAKVETRIRPHSYSDFIAMINARHASHSMTDCLASRPSIEMLLRHADGDDRQELLHALYKSKKTEVDKTIDKLLEDFSYSYYNSDFFRFVVSTPDLARRVKEFVGMRDRNQLRRQAVTQLFVLAALESGSPSLIEPAIFKPYDLSSDYDLDSFDSLLSNAFSQKSAAPEPNFCAAVAAAGLSYMAGFGKSYRPVPPHLRRHHAERFVALADRLGKVALAEDGPPYDKSGKPKPSGHIARMLRECDVSASSAKR